MRTTIVTSLCANSNMLCDLYLLSSTSSTFTSRRGARTLSSRTHETRLKARSHRGKAAAASIMGTNRHGAEASTSQMGKIVYQKQARCENKRSRTQA